MRKRGLWLAMLLGMLLGFVPPTRAQEAPSRTILVSYTARNRDDARRILGQVRAELRQHGFNLVVTPITHPGIPTSLSFRGDGILITSSSSPLARVSPFLVHVPVLFSPPDNPTASQLIAAELLYLQNQCALSEQYWAETRLSMRHLDWADIAMRRSNCALLAGDYRDAITIWENAQVAVPGQGFNAAWAYLQLGEEEKALREADAQVRLARCPRCTINDLVFALTRRSHLRALAFRFEEAIADMNAAIALEPDNPELYVERGQRILLIYEWDRVLADYDRALALDPDYAPAYFHRGVLYYTQGPRERAIDDFRRYLALAPGGPFAEQAARYIESIEIELAALSD